MLYGALTLLALAAAALAQGMPLLSDWLVAGAKTAFVIELTRLLLPARSDTASSGRHSTAGHGDS
jgi:hypothetical protein